MRAEGQACPGGRAEPSPQGAPRSGEAEPALPGRPFQRAMRRQAAARRWRCRSDEQENGIFQEDRRRARTAGGREQEVWIFQEDRRRGAVGPCQFTHCVITCSPAQSRSPVPRPPRAASRFLSSCQIPSPCSPSPAPRPGSCSPAKSRSPVPRPPHRNSGGVFNMMSGWTGRAYQTAWTLDFASERSDAKSHVRNRQDGPDIMHLKRTRNVRLSNFLSRVLSYHGRTDVRSRPRTSLRNSMQHARARATFRDWPAECRNA